MGCLATTFTFGPAFFEEECLGRFLGLESDPTEDGPIYLIEREEKLAQVRCAAALVDQHHAKGTRSLRWDLIPVRAPGGALLHAKISLLRWQNHVRLMVASANLTEDGYRRNREIFGVLDYHAGSKAPLDCLDEIVDFLREVLAAGTDHAQPADPARARCVGLLDDVAAATRDWGRAAPARGGRDVRVAPVLVGPGRPSALEQVRDVAATGGPPGHAVVVSPFFDPDGETNAPAQALWGILKQRGEASVRFLVSAENVPGEDALFVQAPRSLVEATPQGRAEVYTDLARDDPTGDDASRPLHLKGLWLDGARGFTCMMGSSNFTSRGLGLGSRPNFEANVAYTANVSNEAAIDALERAQPRGEFIGDDEDVRFRPRDQNEDSEDPATILLPVAFGVALYGRDERRSPFLELHFLGEPPAGWTVATDDGDTLLLEASTWQAEGSPSSIRLMRDEYPPPTILEVRWAGSAGPAWWPVQAMDAGALPPPEELQDLPLDLLIRILTSARPLHQAMRAWVRRRSRSTGEPTEGPALDPHKRVDTSAFLLQRTRRVSWALAALRQRLENPTFTLQSLRWRLSGPVGVRALVRAIQREAHSAEESSFLLAELALELSRVQPRTSPGSIAPEIVRAEIAAVIVELRELAHAEPFDHTPRLGDYIGQAFEAALP